MSLYENLPKHIADALEKGGIKTIEQCILTTDNYYLDSLNFCMDDIKLIKTLAASELLSQGIKNSLEVYEIENSLKKISFGCKVIDEYLQGGLRVGTITEIYGESGCGKTQIALQIAANCWNTGAVYIATEDIFPSKRLQQMFSNIKSREKSNMEISKYGENIFVMEIIELNDLKTCINTLLPRLINDKRNISLIVIDSITAPFRSEFQNDMRTRAQHIKEIGMALMNLAVKHNISVLCINQVLSTMDSSSCEDDTIPCLGLTWSNLLTSRIKVKKLEKYCRMKDITHNESDNNLVQARQLQVVTSPELPSTESVEYFITSGGVVGSKS